MKKRDKKRFKRQNIKLNNLKLADVEKLSRLDVVNEKRAEKKKIEVYNKSRKKELNLVKGRVLEIKSNHKCRVEIAEREILCSISGRLKQLNFETRSLVAAGDLVNVDLSADEARIEEVLPRKNQISRFSEKRFQTEIILASNIDQVIVTVSCAEPKLNLSLVDRFICSAEIANLNSIICINKIDLDEDVPKLKKKLEFYDELGYKIVCTSAKDKTGLIELRAILKDRDSIFTGHSGVGKSSLINLLNPDIDLPTSEVSESTKKGMHTTTSTKLIKWDFGGFLIDTPGIKTLGLHRDNKMEIPKVFPGFRKLATGCRFADCTHIHEENCAVKKAVAEKNYPIERYESYLRLFDSLS